MPDDLLRIVPPRSPIAVVQTTELTFQLNNLTSNTLEVALSLAGDLPQDGFRLQPPLARHIEPRGTELVTLEVACGTAPQGRYPVQLRVDLPDHPDALLVSSVVQVTLPKATPRTPQDERAWRGIPWWLILLIVLIILGGILSGYWLVYG